MVDTRIRPRPIDPGQTALFAHCVKAVRDGRDTPTLASAEMVADAQEIVQIVQRKRMRIIFRKGIITLIPDAPIQKTV